MTHRYINFTYCGDNVTCISPRAKICGKGIESLLENSMFLILIVDAKMNITVYYRFIIYCSGYWKNIGNLLYKCIFKNEMLYKMKYIKNDYDSLNYIEWKINWMLLNECLNNDIHITYLYY